MNQILLEKLVSEADAAGISLNIKDVTDDSLEFLRRKHFGNDLRAIAARQKEFLKEASEMIQTPENLKLFFDKHNKRADNALHGVWNYAKKRLGSEKVMDEGNSIAASPQWKEVRDTQGAYDSLVNHGFSKLWQEKAESISVLESLRKINTKQVEEVKHITDPESGQVYKYRQTTKQSLGVAVAETEFIRNDDGTIKTDLVFDPDRPEIATRRAQQNNRSNIISMVTSQFNDAGYRDFIAKVKDYATNEEHSPEFRKMWQDDNGNVINFASDTISPAQYQAGLKLYHNLLTTKGEEYLKQFNALKQKNLSIMLAQVVKDGDILRNLGQTLEPVMVARNKQLIAMDESFMQDANGKYDRGLIQSFYNMDGDIDKKRLKEAGVLELPNNSEKMGAFDIDDIADRVEDVSIYLNNKRGHHADIESILTGLDIAHRKMSEL